MDAFVGTVVGALVAALGFLLHLVARRLERHLDRQDTRLERVERAVGDIRAYLKMRRQDPSPTTWKTTAASPPPAASVAPGT